MSLPSEGMPDREWKREAKRQVDPYISGYPFPTLASAPATANLRAGYTYYDTALGKARTWDGVTFNNLF